MPKQTEKKSALTKQGYSLAVQRLFEKLYRPGASSFFFTGKQYRDICDSDEVVEANGGERIRNPADVLYAFRSRRKMPEAVEATAPAGKQWIIELAGREGGDSRYCFRLVNAESNLILPRDELVPIDIPNATPEIIGMYALTDEQALLAKLRYNRLIDIFLGIAAFSLQSHLKTHVKEVGNVEVDELYVGLDKQGRHYIVPVQAKGGKDKLHSGQLKQDIALCAEQYPKLICRPVSAQFMSEARIALFELTVIKNEVKIIDERHYRLVPAKALESASAAGT